MSCDRSSLSGCSPLLRTERPGTGWGERGSGSSTRELTPQAKEWRILGMRPPPRPHHSSTCPAGLTQKYQRLSQCRTRPKGTVVTVPICSRTRSQPVRLAGGGWGPLASRSRSEPSSETLRLQHCWGQGTVTQPRWQHPLPAHHPARCHRAIRTWASRPEPGLLPPRAGHRGQMAPGVQGRGRLLPTAPPPLLLLLAPGPAWATRRGSEMRRPAAHSELPPTGCGTHLASAPRGHPGCQRLGAGAASRERKQHVPTSSWQTNHCARAVSASPPARPGPSAGQPVPPAARWLVCPPSLGTPRSAAGHHHGSVLSTVPSSPRLHPECRVPTSPSPRLALEHRVPVTALSTVPCLPVTLAWPQAPCAHDPSSALSTTASPQLGPEHRVLVTSSQP